MNTFGTVHRSATAEYGHHFMLMGSAGKVVRSSGTTFSASTSNVTMVKK